MVVAEVAVTEVAVTEVAVIVETVVIVLAVVVEVVTVVVVIDGGMWYTGMMSVSEDSLLAQLPPVAVVT